MLFPKFIVLECLTPLQNYKINSHVRTITPLPSISRGMLHCATGLIIQVFNYLVKYNFQQRVQTMLHIEKKTTQCIECSLKVPRQWHYCDV